jgi:glyoxylase-like metal-dependent hydrolase (beta-lactamase superfamily II)
MKYAVAISAALLFGASQLQPAVAQGPNDLVKQAIDAQGGADALRALKGVVIKGDAKHWEPGQAYAPGGESKFIGDSKFTLTADAGTRTVRIDWDRDKKYPAVEKIVYSEVISPSFGVVTDEKGSQPMSGIRLASHLREVGRSSPLLLLKALDAPQNVAAIEDQKLGDRTLPAVSLTDGNTKYIIMFDRQTKLPAAIRTRDDDHLYGDSNFDLILSDWRQVGAVKVAHSLTNQINGKDVQQLTYTEFQPNPTIAPATFAVSDEVKAKARAAATSDVPYQWVLRRMFLGRFLDSDQVSVPAGGSHRLSELAPKVQQVVGGAANNLIVEMKDGLVVFDAPIDDVQSLWVINAAKAKYPGKPIKHLVLTHHHMDHTGGMRAYVAEGATVIVPAPAKALFEQVVQAPRTVRPDTLAKQVRLARQPEIVEVKDQMSLKDDTVEINLHNIPNPHADGMIIGHVVKENIVYVCDIWSPGRDAIRNPNTLALAEAVKKIGIKDATFAGGHGSTAKQSVLEGITAQN